MVGLGAPKKGFHRAQARHVTAGFSMRCSWELKALGDYHQHLLKMRLEGGLEGIEMGPILGRGSFGRVYKGVPTCDPMPHEAASRSLYPRWWS